MTRWKKELSSEIESRGLSECSNGYAIRALMESRGIRHQQWEYEFRGALNMMNSLLSRRLGFMDGRYEHFKGYVREYIRSAGEARQRFGN